MLHLFYHSKKKKQKKKKSAKTPNQTKILSLIFDLNQFLEMNPGIPGLFLYKLKCEPIA